MKTCTRIISILALFVLMLTGAWATAQSGNAANKKAGDTPAPSPAATTEKKTKTTGSMQNAQSNPLYKDNKLEGTNPLYEGRDSAARTQAPSHGATATHDVVEYKDGEDATTRYRPGNKKATKTATPVAPPSSPDVVEYKDGEDPTTQTRPSKPR
jgi:hypothetical protein